MFFHGADQGDSEPAPDQSADTSGGGDGFHHHELHEDESGFHSVHTHPDGHKEMGDHATYEEARDHMDAMHGHGEPDGDESGRDSGDSFDSGGGDAGEAYRKSCG